ncbi:hypothetical protein LPJ64_000935, partial [Coemansia asiatica]
QQQQQQSNSALSFFGRLTSSISALISSSNVTEEGPVLPLDSKSQIEDMLESYYLSQGRPVPGWVNRPPSDPPMGHVDVQKTSGSPTNNDSGSQVPNSSEHSSSKSSNQGMISRSIARLNFARIPRPQISFGLRSSSASASESSNADDRARRNVHDSGFNSPSGLDLPSIHETPSISVQMVDELGSSRYDNSAADSERELTDTPAYDSTETFQLDSDQLAASVSASDRESSPGYFSPKWFHKSPKPVQRNRTMVNRWLHGEEKQGSKKQASTPISLSSLMPQSNNGKARSTRNRVFQTGSPQSQSGAENDRSANSISRSITPVPIKKSPLSRTSISASASASASATPKKTHDRFLTDDVGIESNSSSKEKHQRHLPASSSFPSHKRSVSHGREKKQDLESSHIMLRPSSHSRSKSAASNNSTTSTPVSSRVKRLFRRKSSHKEI